MATNGLGFPVEFPVWFVNTSNSGLHFPVSFPMTFEQYGGMRFPLTFPMDFASTQTISGFTFPMTFPMRFQHGTEVRHYVNTLIKFTASTQPYYGTAKLPYAETAYGKISKVLFKEKAWWFPGLIVSENVIKEMSTSLNVTENVQARILADFELESTNKVKVSWYGNTVPSVQIMKKADSDDTYTMDGIYDWDVGTAEFEISSEDYNVYLQGTLNSGTSELYTIGGVNDTVVVPEVEIALNEKIYDLEIDNTGTYYLTINY